MSWTYMILWRKWMKLFMSLWAWMRFVCTKTFLHPLSYSFIHSHSLFFINHNILTNVYILCCFHSVLLILRWRVVIIGEKMFHLFVLKLYPSIVRLRTTVELWSVWFSTCIYSSALMSSWIYIYIKPTHGVNNVTNWLRGNNTALSYRWKDGDNQR